MEHSLTKSERRERQNRASMVVSGRNLKKLAQHIARRKPADPSLSYEKRIPGK